MSSLTPYRTVKNGIYYTPPPLARMLADQIIQRSDIAILDPACGNGALLWAAARKCRQLSDGLRDRPSLYGCDKFKPVALSREGRRINFTKTNGRYADHRHVQSVEPRTVRIQNPVTHGSCNYENDQYPHRPNEPQRPVLLRTKWTKCTNLAGLCMHAANYIVFQAVGKTRVIV